MIQFSSQILGDLQGLYQAAARRIRVERDTVIHNRRKYGSDHYSSASSMGDLFGMLGKDDRIQRSMFQKIRPTIKTEIANLFEPIPMEAIPTTDSVVTKLQAESAEALFRYYFRFDPQLIRQRYNTLLGAAIDRAGWLKVFWDPHRRGFNKPDLGFEYVDLLSAPFDPSCKSLDEAKFVCHVKLMSKMEAEAIFQADIEGKPVGWETASTATQYTSDAIYASDPLRLQASTTDPRLQMVRIVEMYFRQSVLFPQGAVFVFTGQSLLAAEDRLDVFPMIPYVGMNKIPGRAIPDGTITDVSGLQDDINFFTSRIKEQALMASAITLAVPREASVKKADIDNLDGTILEYNAGAGKPDWMVAPGPQQSILAALDKAEMQFMEASGYHDAQRGLSTNSQANAKLLSYQEQLAKSVLRPDQALAALSDIEVAKAIVRTVALNATEGQMLRLMGGNSKPIIQTFQQGMFDPDIDVGIDIGAPPPQSQELLEAKAMEIMSSGGFEDTPAAERFRTVVRRYTTKGDTNPKAAHESRALREQVDFVLTGIPPVALPQDDAECHLKLHEEFSVSDEFLSMDPMAQQGFIEHMAAHQMAYQQAYAAQMGMASPAPATAPGPSSGYASPDGAQDNEKGAESPFSGGQSSNQATMGSDGLTG